AQQPVVQLEDANGNPVSQSDVTVAASVASGPAGTTLTGATATTGATGTASFSGLTINGSTGTYTLSFGANTLTPVASNAIALSAGVAATIAPNSPASQTAIAGTAVTSPPSVIVKDGNGNPVTGVAVTFAVAPGNGTITGGSQTTNASGVATVGSWTLSATAGSNTLTASSGTLSGSPVTFSATGTAGAAATLAANSPTTQTATAGTAVNSPPSVIVKDANGNPVTGVAVTFAV